MILWKSVEIAYNFFIGEKVPYENWNIWGYPETLQGTNGKYWIAFLPKANISFVSSKENDLIEYIDFGKDKASEWVKGRLSKRSSDIKRQFNLWDGSHINLTKEIKKSMHDPNSYEHVSTSYYDMNDYLIIKTKIRGNNAFGQKVLTSFTAKVSNSGEVLEISE